MEQFIQNLPRSVLAIGAILIAVVFFWFADPPHTICDAEKLAQQEALSGFLYPIKTKEKQTIPAKIVAAKESCLEGNSAGACFEYFEILKKITLSISSGSYECRSTLLNEKDVKKTIEDAIEVMARMAWGVNPPLPTIVRFGWFQESELHLFCRLKNTYSRAAGEEAYDSLRNKINKKFPGEEPPQLLPSEAGESEAPPVRNATEVFTEQEIWDRSVFSLRCEQYGL